MKEQPRNEFGLVAHPPAMGPEEALAYLVLWAILLLMAVLFLVTLIKRRSHEGDDAFSYADKRMRQIKYMSAFALLTGTIYFARAVQRVLEQLATMGDALDRGIGPISEDMSVPILALGICAFGTLLLLLLSLGKRQKEPTGNTGD